MKTKTLTSLRILRLRPSLSSCKLAGAGTEIIRNVFLMAASTSAVEDASLTIEHSVDARITAAVTLTGTCSSVFVAVIITVG